MRDQNGEMAPIKVVDMTDPHLFRWIRYFRKKWRDEGFQGSDAKLDAIIKAQMVTAPAIYAEAIKRGVFNAPPSDPVTEKKASTDDVLPGKRRITLEED